MAGLPRIEVKGCTKTFPGVRALDDVSIAVMPGEIHALLGENGAGKSTLGKIIGGVYQPDGGEVVLDGETLGAIDEAAAGRRGIGMVHQEGSLVSQLSVAENIFAGRQPTTFLGMVDKKQMYARTRELMSSLGVSIDPARKVRELSTAQMQVIEIAKALSHDLKLLILDEPTASLTLQETDRLFALIRKLATSGVAIVYVSHRLAEIFALCDRITVLKDGRVSGTREVAATNEAELIRLMVGRDVLFERAAVGTLGEVILEVENLRVGNVVDRADLTVRSGEIVCISGLVGSGRSELCETIFGVRRHDRGDIRFCGKSVGFRNPGQAIAAGIGMMPEDRKSAGLFLDQGIVDNISVTVLDRVSPYGVCSVGLAERLAEGFVESLNISTTSVRQRVGNLSGGNQQKVLLAKWLAPKPKLLIVDEPTRGVDVGARAEIYRILTDLKAQGMAILAVSSDLPEVLAIADRIVVMSEGGTVGELDGPGATEESILQLATRKIDLGTSGETI